MPPSVRLTHIGGPTVLLEVGPWRLLTDPTFDAPGLSYAFTQCTSSRKTHGPTLDPSGILPIDAVLLSHDQHADNLDGLGRRLLSQVGRVVTTQEGAARLGGGAVGLRRWETTTLQAPGRDDIEIMATPCRHGPPLLHRLAGPVTGFALRWRGQAHGALWISGDTVWFRGLSEIPKRMPIGTAIVHLGGVHFPLTGALRYTMGADQLHWIFRSVEPRRIVPVHFEGWSHFEPASSLLPSIGALPEIFRSRVTVPHPGVPLELDV
jgi:L-ascorbate metabolism protein UlaG (beta-lactamase superfamily)